MPATKTDNRSLALKVEIRRRILDEAGFDSLLVLDLCAGAGHIWRAMRAHYAVKEYTPCDREPRMPGTIKGDLSERFLSAFDLSRFNVVDVDCYGTPWAAWLFLSGRVQGPTAFFLTAGVTGGPGGGAGGATLPNAERDCLGIPRKWALPAKRELATYAGSYCLAAGAERCEVKRVYECKLPNVSYYGLLVEGKP